MVRRNSMVRLVSCVGTGKMLRFGKCNSSCVLLWLENLNLARYGHHLTAEYGPSNTLNVFS